jgi:hypothetical protein
MNADNKDEEKVIRGFQASLFFSASDHIICSAPPFRAGLEKLSYQYSSRLHGINSLLAGVPTIKMKAPLYRQIFK